MTTNRGYDHPEQKKIAFPMGGIGAGMICLEGTGAFSHFSIHNRPGISNEPCVFAAVHIKDMPNGTKVLEGQVPGWKITGRDPSGGGLGQTSYGFPRFRNAAFEARFPFGLVSMSDPSMPIEVVLTGWSPFIPGNADDSSMPCALLEYELSNKTGRKLQGVFSFNALNFLSQQQGNFKEPPDSWKTEALTSGFVLRAFGREARPHVNSSFAVVSMEKGTKVNAAWFRGSWFDPLTMAWNDIASGVCRSAPPPADGGQAPGASLFIPFTLNARSGRTIRLMMCWYTPSSDVIQGDPARRKASCKDSACSCSSSELTAQHHSPWYAGRFSSVEELTGYLSANHARLRRETLKFTDRLYGAKLPPEVLDAVSANLTILKSPTVLRDRHGRIWGWEGCNEKGGCCHGSCTHVWNYAQSMPHLFPALERTLRETEFFVSQKQTGYQAFRSNLPIEPVENEPHPAADGQLGGIMKVYRDFSICGDLAWLTKMWPRVKLSLDFCIGKWDPRRQGYLEEPQHNTYDIEFWGPNGMLTSFYLGALKAACLMGKVMGEETPEYARLYEAGRKFMESELFNGEYFFQQTKWEGLKAGKPLDFNPLCGNVAGSPESRAIIEKEGPKYQYGTGCLSDGILGAWMAEVCGIGEILDPSKVRSHLKSVFKYNFKKSLLDHANPQRPGYALGDEGGLILCTWPRGGKPSLPFPYSDEVWTGFEYQAASHMIMHGMAREGLAIVKAARKRYDGTKRNPFNEYECGHWYARAMSSYALLQALGVARKYPGLVMPGRC